MSREQVPVLAAADRGGGNASAVLPKVSGAALKGALLPVIETDIVPVSNANRVYPHAPRRSACAMRRST